MTTLVMKVIAAKDILQQSLIRIIVTHQFSLRLSQFHIVTGYFTFQQLAYLVKSNLTVVAGPTAIL